MSYNVSRGWINSSDESFVRETSILNFDSDTIESSHIGDLITKYGNLVSLIFTGCTFGAGVSFENMPVAENAATLTTLTASGSTGLSPGPDSDGVPVAWATAVEIAAVDVSNNGWSIAEVDAFIIALDVAVQAGLGGSAAACTLDISSNAIPSPASSAARSALAGYSPAWTLTIDS